MQLTEQSKGYKVYLNGLKMVTTKSLYVGALIWHQILSNLMHMLISNSFNVDNFIYMSVLMGFTD